MLVLLSGPAAAQVTWHVDRTNCPGPGSGTPADPYCTIQAAIDASSNGDTVLVDPGLYVENLDFSFKSIEARSVAGAAATIISAATAGNSAVIFENGDCLFDGFTVTGGHSSIGGGGMDVIHNATVVTNCVFAGNTADFIGGGFLNFGGEPVLHNCLFVDNAAQSGGGFYNDHGTSTVINCTFVRNTADAEGGGAYVNVQSASFVNCIFWNNSDVGGNDESAQVSTFGGSVSVAYSCIQNLDTLVGNNNVGGDPSFVDEAVDGFRLSYGSTLIDAGDNAVVILTADLDGNPRRVDDPNVPDSGNGEPPIVDLGPYESDGTVPPGIPATSLWGVTVLALLLAVFGSHMCRRRPPARSSSVAT